MKLAIIAAIAVAVVGCHQSPSGPPPEVPDPNPEVPATVDDVAVCAHLAMLGCREAWPNGGSCIEVFTQAHTDGIPTPPDLMKCLANATTQAIARACGGPDTLTFRCGSVTP